MVPPRLYTGQGIGWCWTTNSRYYNGFTLTRQMLDQRLDFSVHMVGHRGSHEPPPTVQCTTDKSLAEGKTPVMAI